MCSSDLLPDEYRMRRSSKLGPPTQPSSTDSCGLVANGRRSQVNRPNACAGCGVPRERQTLGSLVVAWDLVCPGAIEVDGVVLICGKCSLDAPVVGGRCEATSGDSADLEGIA